MGCETVVVLSIEVVTQYSQLGPAGFRAVGAGNPA